MSRCLGCGGLEGQCVCEMVELLCARETEFQKVTKELNSLNETKDRILGEKISIIEAISTKRGYLSPAYQQTNGADVAAVKPPLELSQVELRRLDI